ncbi:MAG: hypothetical protein HY272_07015 [Gammaproteobacteria bacterium]|nr:hypothetical protein [Gammaproteobacteria bacterium]
MFCQWDSFKGNRQCEISASAKIKSVISVAMLCLQFSCGVEAAALFHVPVLANPKTPEQQLIDAVNAANAAGEPAVIEIEAGIYTFIQATDHVEGDNALPAITGDVTLRGLGDGPAQTIIQRDDATAGVPKFRIMHVAPVGKLTLERLTLRGGSTTCDDRCINNDHPMDTGGGVYVLGIRQVENGPEIRGQLFVRNSILRDNKSENCGGAIRNDGGYVEVEDSLITNNRTRYAIDGAGIYNDAHYKQHRATAIMPAILGRLIVRRSTFSANITGGQGAGVFNEKGNADIDDSSFVGNFSRLGGGGIGNGIGNLNVSNTTIYGNYTMGQGGGIIASNSSEEYSNPALSQMKLNNVTVSGNVSEGVLVDPNSGMGLGGGGLAMLWGFVELKNSVISGNSDPKGRECFTALSNYNTDIGITSLGNNLLGEFSVCQPHMLTVNSDLLAVKPGLASCRSFAANGSAHLPIETVNSAVYGAGNIATCIIKDQLGKSRSQRCSIGAVEYYDVTVTSGQVCPVAISDDEKKITNYTAGNGGAFESIFGTPNPGSSVTPDPTSSQGNVVPSDKSGQVDNTNKVSSTNAPESAAGGGGAEFWLSAGLLLWNMARRRHH